MAYTVHLIKSPPDTIEADLKAYLDGETITTLHAISAFRYGAFVYALVTFE